MQGESGSADNEAITQALPDLKETIARFHPRDVFNMDETGLFYCMAPDRTIAARQLAGMKKEKTRMTVALCANADGSEKLEPFFIGHYLKPRAFQKKSGANLGLYYRANSKAWMTGVLFQEWLLILDKRMSLQNRKILCHVVKDLFLKSIEICFLPPNATSRLQPMDQGIIAAFKKRFRSYQLEHAVERLDDIEGRQNERFDIYKVDILKAIRWCQNAWKDISSSTIRNSWEHSVILDRSQAFVSRSTIQADDQKLDANLSGSMKRLSVNPLTIEELINLDEAVVQTPLDELDEKDIIELVEAEDNEPEVVDQISSAQPVQHKVGYTTEQKIEALTICINIFEDTPCCDIDVVKPLRRRLGDLKSELLQRKQESLRQTSISSYFQSK